MTMNSNPQVTIVDDDYSSIFIVQEYIQHFVPNATVSGFVRPAEALKELSKQEAPDVLFVDLKMPDIDGFEFLDQWQPKEGKKTRIFVLSSSISPKDRNRSLNYPIVEDYFCKPLSTDDVHRIFSGAIEAG